MLERNCSVGKGRRVRGENGEILDTDAYASLVDERVERCGGGKEPFLIGVAGGTASGKTTVCDLIMHNLQEKRVVLIAQDSYYRGLTPEEHDNVSSYNFDHPDAIDVKALVATLKALLLRNPVKVPVYDFVTHARVEETIAEIEPADVIIIEGILVLAMKEVRDLCHMKIFVDTDDDLRLARRLKRDTVDRGRSVDGVITQYTTFVKPMFDTFVSPSKKYADVIIPWAQGENTVAIDLIVQHIRTKLGQNDLRRIYPNLIVLHQLPNRGMHTIIRSARCVRSDFVFYSDRSSGSSSSTRSAICRSRTSPCARRTVTPTTACVSPRRFAASPSSARRGDGERPPRLLQGDQNRKAAHRAEGQGRRPAELGGDADGRPRPLPRE